MDECIRSYKVNQVIRASDIRPLSGHTQFFSSHDLSKLFNVIFTLTEFKYNCSDLKSSACYLCLFLLTPLLRSTINRPSSPRIRQTPIKRHKRLLIIRPLGIHNLPLSKNSHSFPQIILSPHFCDRQSVYLC